MTALFERDFDILPLVTSSMLSVVRCTFTDPARPANLAGIILASFVPHAGITQNDFLQDRPFSKIAGKRVFTHAQVR